jgi:2,4-dienoyl-CoA reductase-like NADH-dependent reductase (Old Yellow Enzyme family)
MQERNPDLFTPVEVGPLALKNRVAMAPLTRSRAGPGNVPTQLSALYYAQRASAGLIIAEATQISPDGQGYISTPGIHSKEQIEGWKCVTKAVHISGAPMVLRSGMSAVSPTLPSNRVAQLPSRLRQSSPKCKLSRPRASSQFQPRAPSRRRKFPASSSAMPRPHETPWRQDSMVWRSTPLTAI